MTEIASRIFRQQIEISKHLLMGIEEALYFLDDNKSVEAKEALLNAIGKIKSMGCDDDGK